MRKIILLLAAGLLLLAGCSDIVQQENDTDPSSGGAAGAFLRVTAETEGFGAREEEASARTALPTIDGSAVTDSFTYTLKGTKEGGSEETLVSGVSLAKLKESLIPVTTGKWSFTLKAEKDGTVFTGTLSDKTITTGDNELSFTISWDESALSGKGSLAFSLDWSKAGLNSVEAAAGTLFAYDPDTGTETETDYTESSDAITLDKDAHTVTYSLSDVPAGVYMIKISFYSDAEKTNLAGTWRELAVITGGQKSGASRVMDVFVKHSATIDPKKDGGLSGITQKTSSVEGIVTLAENTDGTYTLTSQGMGTSVLTFSGTNADGENVAVTYNVSVSDTGELTVGSPKVVYSVTVAGGIEHGTVTAEPAPAAAGETVTLTVTPDTGYAGSIAIKDANGGDISSSVSLSQDSEDTTKWTFIMPEGTVTISAIFEDTEPFTTTLKRGDVIKWIQKSQLNSSAKQFKKSITRNASATEYLDLNNKIPVWYDSSSETIYYYIPASCTSVMMNEDSSQMFYEMEYLTSIEINGFDTSSVKDMTRMFANCSALKSLDLNSFDTSNVTTMEGMFERCTSIESLDLNNFDTSNVTNMQAMFGNCTALKSLDLGDSFDTGNVTNMQAMFCGCSALKSLDLGDSFDTGNVTNMESMFRDCSALESLDLNSFDTSKVTTMSLMFNGCSALKSLDLNSFDTSKVTGMMYMFADCTALESLDLNSFDTSNVTTMEVMFCGCSALESLDLSSFDTSKVTTMRSIFGGCSSLKTIYASDTFVTTNVNSHIVGSYSGLYCFLGCTSLVGGSGTTYDESEVHATYARIDGGESAPGYFTAKATTIGTKSKPDAVGDIVFSDGSATPYTADLTLTEEQKAAAIAVIFDADKKLGVGLKNTGTDSTLAWAKNGNTNITAIQCTPSESGIEKAATATFEGDTDGSDNWQTLCNVVNDEDTSGNYPAWEWVNAYATTANLTGDYASGWYLPTVAELSMLYRAKNTVNSALEKAGGTEIADAGYWSSSQSASGSDYAWYVWFDDGTLSGNLKSYASSVCTVRAFSGTTDPGNFTMPDFVLVKGTTIKGDETWTPPSKVFVSERSLTIPDLYVCNHEVTRGEFKALMGTDPSTARAYDKDGNELTGDAVLNNPVNCVNWYDAIAYCNKLSVKEGLAPAYTVSGITDWENLAYSAIPISGDATWNAATCDFTANGYRLPTVAEWEWLARGGQNYTYAGSDTVGEVAWYTGNTHGSRDVKTKAANGYGLYDMSGNVWEWCWDWETNDTIITESTPAAGASSGSGRVNRGGSWYYIESFCAVSHRTNNYPYYRDYSGGFRVVRNAN